MCDKKQKNNENCNNINKQVIILKCSAHSSIGSIDRIYSILVQLYTQYTFLAFCRYSLKIDTKIEVTTYTQVYIVSNTEHLQQKWSLIKNAFLTPRIIWNFINNETFAGSWRLAKITDDKTGSLTVSGVQHIKFKNVPQLLEELDSAICSRTVSSRLIDSDLHSYRSAKKPLVSERNREKNECISQKIL